MDYLDERMMNRR